ncbi:hypothetical protein [Kitasatospora sp. MAP5-34]|nr:hypothetical protein [Kitasatospora sp. MAP5-34]MDH6578623.1 hypothetical protein [Kitasatospora sp. MAP5-34]
MTTRHDHEHEDPSVHSFILSGQDTVFGHHLAAFGSGPVSAAGP